MALTNIVPAVACKDIFVAEQLASNFKGESV